MALERLRQHRYTASAHREPDVTVFLTIMQILHSEPTVSSFMRLLRKQLEPDDYVPLSHLFEEISVLAVHGFVHEHLLIDALALDMYWDELREDIFQVRRSTGNPKFCENFEAIADRAREYRRPPSDGPGGGFGGRSPRGDDPRSPSPHPESPPPSELARGTLTT